MLEKVEKLTITGKSVIGENVVCSFTAVIDCNDPAKMIVNQVQQDKEAYKANREECRADFAAFEDCAFNRQNELLKALEPKE